MTRWHIVTSMLTAILLTTGHAYCQDQATIRSIVDVLREGHLSGSLQYRGRCGNEGEYVTPNFPITTTPKRDSHPPLQTIREMFAKDEDIGVTQEPNGTIRIVEKAVPQDLLNVKIKHLSFDDEQGGHFSSISPPLVIGFITAAPEVEAFMKDHNMIWEPRQIIEATTSEPHISGELNNVTLSQALDYIARTFHGLWVYKECPGNKKNERIVDLRFFGYR